MQKIVTFLKNSRFGLLPLFGIVYLAVSTLLRMSLLASSWEATRTTVWGLCQILFVGALYDVVFYLYFSVFFAFLLLLLPEFVYRSKIYKYSTFFFVFLFLYGTYFVTLAEWLFWDEFKTRFNFIAIDYLVYTDEVFQNIYESYPLGWIFLAIFIVAISTFFLLKRPLILVLQVKEKFSHRLAASAVVFSLALCSYFFIGQSWRGLSDNNYVNELGSSGPYQFVAAFRNNSLDYKTFGSVEKERP